MPIIIQKSIQLHKKMSVLNKIIKMFENTIKQKKQSNEFLDIYKSMIRFYYKKLIFCNKQTFEF